MNQSTPQPPKKNYLRVHSNGTKVGTHVFLPNGEELKGTRVVDVRVEARQAEICELEFYLGEGQPTVFVNGTKEDGVYFGHLGVADRMDGLVRCEITPVEQDSQGIAKIRFYPAGSKFAPIQEPPFSETNAIPYAGLPGRIIKRPHINVEGKFQSDKYPTCPAGKVPLSTKDKTAQDSLWQYAQRRRVVDAEFAEDLETCLVRDGYAPPQRETMVASAAPDKTALLELLELAWGVIANAHGGNWPSEGEWRGAAIDWREKYFTMIGRTWTPKPPPKAAPVSVLPALEAKLRGDICTALHRCLGTSGLVAPNHAVVDALFALIELGTPSLGCATTGELLEELAARAELHGYSEKLHSIASTPPTGGIPTGVETAWCKIGDALAALRWHADRNGYTQYRTIDENSSTQAHKGEAAYRTPQP